MLSGSHAQQRTLHRANLHGCRTAIDRASPYHRDALACMIHQPTILPVYFFNSVAHASRHGRRSWTLLFCLPYAYA